MTTPLTLPSAVFDLESPLCDLTHVTRILSDRVGAMGVGEGLDKDELGALVFLVNDAERRAKALLDQFYAAIEGARKVTQRV